MSEKRFVAHDTSVEDYVESIKSKNTKQKTKRDVKLLEEFLRNKTSQNIYITYAYNFYELLNLIWATQFVIKRKFKSQYVYNKHNASWKVYAYSIYALVGLYQKSHSFDF